jgi:TrmH family RNA methyltransferase
VRVVQVPETVLEAMSPAQTPAGVVALGARPRHTLDGILSGAAVPLVSVLVDVQDPGNVGAIARVSEAAGATGLLACGSSADPFGWKALRGSMGSAFRLPIAQEADTAAAIAALRARGLQIVGTAPAAAIPFDRVEWRRPTAFLVGSEGAGLDAAAARAADVMAAIPMQPPVESLNVAVSAGLLAYEARRQRTAAGAGR